MAIELDDGTIIRSLPEQVSYNDERIEDNRNDINTLKAQVEAALAGVFHYKGSVATYADLPATGNEVGDVYNVNDTGKNYAWSGSAWDDLGGIVDLSNLATINTTQTITGTKTISNTYLEFSDSGSAAQVEKVQEGLEIDMDGAANYVFGDQGDFYAQNGILTIGTHDNPWDRAHITKYMQANNTTYGFTLPDSTSFTADSELLDTKSAQTITGTKTFNNQIYVSNGTASLIIRNNGWTSEILQTGGVSLGITGDAIRAGSDNTTNLGDSIRRWKNLYVAGKAYIDDINPTNSNLALGTNGYSIISRGSISPNSDGGYDLGNSSAKWKDIHLAGSINMETAAAIKAGGQNCFFVRPYVIKTYSVSPEVDNAYNIGSTNNRYQNIYTINITDSTNTVSIADLKALIDYAKAQGWIS